MQPIETPAVAGTPLLLLRIEGAALAIAGVYLFSKTGVSWWWFAGLFLVPDLSFAGYLAGPRIGAAAYNAMHTLTPPLALALAGFLLPQLDIIAVALIWLAHIGLDRFLGFGLKYGTGFGFTHLGRVGRMSTET